MSVLDALRYRLRVLLHPRTYAREQAEEVEFHLALEAMQRTRVSESASAPHSPLTPDEARYAARRRFGNVTTHREEARRMSGLGFFDVMRQDLRFALRSFRRTPAFTIIAVLTLAIGIGANTAIFSAVNAMLLRPLPFPEPDRLMKVSLTLPARGDQPARDDVVWSYPKFATFRDAQPVFSDLALYADNPFTVRDASGAERDFGEFAGARYLITLGVRPALGRNFLPEEDQHPDGPRVAMISDAFWQRRYDGDPTVLGRIINVNGEPFTIVGVLPPSFKGLSGRAEIWLPILSQDAETIGERWNHSYTLIARLKPGVSIQQATSVVQQLGRVVDAAHPAPELADKHWGAAARPLDAARVNPVVRRALLVLLGAVGLVLLIACANVANLLLLRASGRRREIAVRLAIGAGRARLVRQLLTESVLLAGAGGIASVVVAWWGVKLLAKLDPSTSLRVQQMAGIGVVGFESIHLDLSAFAFAAALALSTGLIFGLVPALQATRPALTEALKSGSAGSRGGFVRGFHGRNVLAVSEIALAIVLLAGSGLMLRSLSKLLAVNPGFDAERVLSMRVGGRVGMQRDSMFGYYDRIIERLSALPGVTSVALGDCPPLNGRCNGTSIKLHDRPAVADGLEPEVGVHWMTPNFPEVLHVPLLRGRLFTSADRIGTRKVVIVNEAAARAFWPGADPIGRPVSVGQGGFWKDSAYVIGVVGNVHYRALDSAAAPDVYLSYYQSPAGRMMLFIRTTGDPLDVAAAARRAIRDVAPDAPVFEVRTMRDRVGDAMAFARFSTTLLGLFAAVALALATMGTYGVISFAVAQRTQEMAIRSALGASRGDVLRLVIGQGLALAATGAGAGLAVALLSTRVLQSLLYEVQPGDPATFVVIVLVLGAAVLIASWIPARRAAGIEPVVALKEGA